MVKRLEFVTMERWDESTWERTESLYEEAFPLDGTKTARMLRSGVERGVAQFHVSRSGNSVEAMAYTGIVGNGIVLLIDYLAVSEELRGSGTGTRFIEYLKEWGRRRGVTHVLIEVEAERGEEHDRRRRFWVKNGFRLVDYVHRYIWVPEPYQAMVCSLQGASYGLGEGPELFRMIGGFHGKVYRGK